MKSNAQEQFTTAVKKRLVEKRMSITKLAQKIGRSRNGVSMAINHPTLFPITRAKIKKELALV